MYSTTCRQLKDSGFQVNSIDSNILPGYYYIEILKDGENAIILSEVNIATCIESVQTDKIYNFHLEKIYSTPKVKNISFRLYKNDVYIDEDLVFPKDQKVYMSKSIVGLCIKR